MLDALDIEIQELEGQLDPGTSNYRYNAMRLDVFRLRRDVIELQEKVKDFEAETSLNHARLEAVELRMSILERALLLGFKPECRDMLTTQVADKVLAKLNVERFAA